jgi:hypothetical protein
LFVLNENGDKRVNLHYKLLLEKHVSFFLLDLFLITVYLLENNFFVGNDLNLF